MPVPPARTTPSKAALVRHLPYAGPTLEYVTDPLGMMRRRLDRHGPVSETRFLGKRWTILLGPDACDHALRNPDKAFANGPGWGELVGPFFDRGLMLLDFAEHHGHRRLMQQAFTRQRLEGYAAALGPAVSAGLDAWPVGAPVGAPGQGATLDAYPALKQLTLGLATQVFLGAPPDAARSDADRAELAAVNRAFVDCVQAATSFVRAPLPGTRWGRAVAGRRLLEDYLGRQLAARQATGDPGGDDLLSALLAARDDDGSAFDDRAVVDHMIFLLMAAHDTSTLTTSTILDQLGRDPQWQERLREEAAHLPDHPTLAELEALPSFELVMKEALRLVPPVPVLARRTVKETEVLGHHVPADRLTAVMLHLSHHLPELWDEPERFDPDRFAEPRREDKRHRAGWEPFGGGVHKCLGLHFAGLEVKLLLHQVLRRWRWTTPRPTPTPLSYLSLPVPRDGLPIELRPLHPRPGRRPAGRPREGVPA